MDNPVAPWFANGDDENGGPDASTYFKREQKEKAALVSRSKIKSVLFLFVLFIRRLWRSRGVRGRRGSFARRLGAACSGRPLVGLPA